MSSYTDEIVALSKAGLTDAQFAAAVAGLGQKADQAAAPVKPAPTMGGKTVQIDPIVPAGTPNTVTMPQPALNGSTGTGHVLSLPQVIVVPEMATHPDAETIGGYFGRVSLQSGGDIQSEGAFAMLLVGPFAQSHGLNVSDPNQWPLIVDWYNNRLLYMSAAERAQAIAAQAQWNATMANIGKQAGTQAAQQQRQHVEANRRHQNGVAQGTIQATATAPTPPPPAPAGDVDVKVQ
jgi:hypothetical protein